MTKHKLPDGPSNVSHMERHFQGRVINVHDAQVSYDAKAETFTFQTAVENSVNEDLRVVIPSAEMSKALGAVKGVGK